MSERREPLVLWSIGCLVLCWSAFEPKDRSVWFMETVPAMAGGLALAFTYRRFPFTPIAYRFIFVFACILMVGGKYTYAEVPAGFMVKEWLGLHRNHFDRMGHFFQGVVPAIVAREILLRRTPLRPGKALFWICASIALAISALYELVEWISAMNTPPEQGLAFLGSQGDVWDAQKDMTMALVGSLVAQLAFARVHDRQIAALAPATSPP